MPDSTDATLIQKHLDGDSRAFGELFAKYHRRLCGYCLRLLDDRRDLDDVLQSAYEKALGSIRSLDNHSLFYYWLFTIARNEVFEVLRQRKKHSTVPLNEEVCILETPYTQLDRENTATFVNRCIAGLRPQFREVIVLRHFEELSYAEIAAITGETVVVVQSRLFKARRALMINLKELWKEERSR
jgi:RNA polymerase sigma-70 factor, ECF subfamily